MNNEKRSVSVEEAQASLNTLNSMNETVRASYRAPTWCIVLNALMFGLMTFSVASMRHENEWVLGLIFSTISIVLISAFVGYSKYLLGIRLRVSANSLKGNIFLFLLTILFSLLLLGTRELSLMGYSWAGLVGSFVNATLLFLWMYFFPTSELSH